MNKKFFAVLMAIVLVISLLPATVLAAEPKHEGCLKPETCTGERLLETEKNGKLEVVWACGKMTTEEISAKPVEPKHEGCLKPETCSGEPLLKTEKNGKLEVVWPCGKLTYEEIPAKPVEPKHEGCLKPETCTGERLMETEKNGKLEVVWACGKLTYEEIPAKPVEPKHEGCLKPETCSGEPLLKTEKNGKLEVVWPCGKLTYEDLPVVEEPECKHTNLVHVEAVEPACHYDGNIEYWICYDCELVWQDEALTQLTNIKNVVLPAIGGDVTHFEAVEPACHYDGNVEYWVCYECEQVWTDEALTQLSNIKNVVLPAIGGDVTHFEAVEPACHYDGNAEYWVCYECEQVWTDEALTQLTNIKNVILPAIGGEVKHVDAVEPDCTIEGNIEYWYCEECEQVWQNESLTQLTNFKRVILPATGHNYVDGICSNCSDKEPVAPIEPKHEGCLKPETCTGERLLETEKNGKLEVVWACGKLTIEDLPVAPIEPKHEGCLKPETCTGERLLETEKNGKLEVVWACGKLTWEDLPVVEEPEHKCFAETKAVATKDGLSHTIECAECGKYWKTVAHNWKDGVCADCGAKSPYGTAPECEHKNTHIKQDIVEATCDFDGYIDHMLICNDCGEIVKSTLYPLAATGHDWVEYEAVAPTCDTDGNIAYMQCATCGAAQTAGENPIPLGRYGWIDSATGHDWVEYDAVVPTCSSEGNVAYHQCSVCGYAETTGENPIPLSKFGWVLGAVAHTNLVHMEAVEPGCHYDGNIEYWVCYDCEQVWQDKDLTQQTNIKNVVLPATGKGNVVHMDAVKPGCHYEGNVEYWICYECEQVWTDEALTKLSNIKSVVLPATGSDKLVHMEAVEPGCHYEGNVEYWVCYECEQVWTDEALTKLSNIKSVVLAAKGGKVIHVEAKAPTTEANGNIEYWYCEDCEQVWQDEALTQLTNFKNVVIAKLDVPSEDENQKTGDEVQIVLMGSMMVLAVLAMAAVVLTKKSSFTGRFTK